MAQFIKEHDGEGDAEAFERALKAMADPKKTISSMAGKTPKQKPPEKPE